MVSALDDAVGGVVAALAAARMANDTLLVFSTDNGGPTNGSNGNNANNWPLRGCKGGYFEGGVRGVGLIAAVELVADKAAKTPFDPVGKIGGVFAARAQAQGVIFRNLGDTIACCPPMIITEAEIDEILDVFGRALEETAAWAAEQGLSEVA